MALLAGSIVLALVPAYFVLQALMVLRYSGPWRIASALPLLLLFPALVFSLFALAAESNLWPMAIIASSLIGGFVLLVLGTAHWLRRGWFV